MTTLYSNSLLAVATLCAVGVSTLTTATPADAKKNACFARAQACERRCARATDDFINCIARTCNPQYDNCMGN